MAFVIDASAALAWCFADEATAATNALLNRLQADEEAVVPAHWPVEVAIALLVAIRRQRISPDDARRFLAALETLSIRRDPTSVALLRTKVLPLGEQFQLTLYDAAYLELAIRLGLPLATCDLQLGAASRAAGVSLIAL